MVESTVENPVSAFRNLGDSSIIKCIGNTPLLEIKLFESEFPEVEVYAKAEWFNPGGSVKDRPALFMVKDGLESGDLRPGKILLDSTSGNTGIAYAMIGAALGIPVRLVLPANASDERKATLKGYGADIILSDPLEGSDGAQRLAAKMRPRRAGKIFPALSVRQPRQPARPRGDHGGRDSGADRRARGALRSGPRHDGHSGGHGARPQGEEGRTFRFMPSCPQNRFTAWKA